MSEYMRREVKIIKEALNAKSWLFLHEFVTIKEHQNIMDRIQKYVHKKDFTEKELGIAKGETS